MAPVARGRPAGPHQVPARKWRRPGLVVGGRDRGDAGRPTRREQAHARRRRGIGAERGRGGLAGEQVNLGPEAVRGHARRQGQERRGRGVHQAGHRGGRRRQCTRRRREGRGCADAGVPGVPRWQRSIVPDRLGVTQRRRPPGDPRYPSIRRVHATDPRQGDRERGPGRQEGDRAEARGCGVGAGAGGAEEGPLAGASEANRGAGFEAGFEAGVRRWRTPRHGGVWALTTKERDAEDVDERTGRKGSPRYSQGDARRQNKARDEREATESRGGSMERESAWIRQTAREPQGGYIHHAPVHRRVEKRRRDAMDAAAGEAQRGSVAEWQRHACGAHRQHQDRRRERLRAARVGPRGEGIALRRQRARRAPRPLPGRLRGEELCETRGAQPERGGSFRQRRESRRAQRRRAQSR